MARSYWKYNSPAKAILMTLAMTGAFVIASTSPYFLTNLVKKYFRYKLRAHRRAMRELEKKKIISFEEKKDGTVKVTLTHRGKEIVRQYQLEEMQIEKPGHWDGKWRVLLYDIPTSRKKAADAFREKLKQLGLYQLQKSVWVHPYEYIGEIDFLCAVFNINLNSHILYFATKEIPRKRLLREFFEL